ncbi:MAG: anaerobic ribonucleoside-triphosphate reductase [Candidatus Hermodarchaeota archaeon]
MSSDKKYQLLEKHLKILGQKIRLDILAKLDNFKEPVPYSVLQKEVLGKNENSTNFSFHLKALKKHNLILSMDNGYSLSGLGKQILHKILSIEQILTDQNKTMMIRTSKYSKEPFNNAKIEEYLIQEGKLDKSLSKEIAREVEDRLSRTKIRYLTAPLMREYINGILLENGLEETRHRLTRLGTPPYEVEKYFKNTRLDPELFLHKLGSESSEQYLLLNLLPKNLADLYLSGDICLLNLNYWSLRPISIYIDSNSIINFIKKDDINHKHIATNYFKIISSLKPYISEDIVLGNFASSFLFEFNNVKNLGKILDFTYPVILDMNNRVCNSNSYLTFEISPKSSTRSKDDELLIMELIKAYITYSTEYSERFDGICINPLIMYDNSSNNIMKNDANLISPDNYKNFVFYDGDKSQLLNSLWINLFSKNKHNKIILDKILINLHKISLESNKNDDLFFELLKERIEKVFELFSYKKDLVFKKLNGFQEWNNLCSTIFNSKFIDLLDNSIKSISFFGLNEAVTNHCGIELDRIETSEKFALNILKFMRKLIQEYNTSENEHFILTQTHQEEFHSQIFPHDKSNKVNQPYCSPNIIRDDSSLVLTERIEIFKKFQLYLEGGSILLLKRENFEQEFTELYEILSNTNLNAFRIY